jgi:HD-like signal output (HDOD) protein
VRDAIIAIGLDRLRSLAVTVVTGNYMRAAFKIEELRRCWRHSLATAVVAGSLGPAFSQDKESAYTAGLLHDLGRLGLLVGYPERYTLILRLAGRNSLDLLDLETREFGMDHCEAGRLLAQKWGLPHDLAVIAGRHHDPETGDASLLATAHFACKFADALGHYVTEPLAPATFEQLFEKLPEQARMKFFETPETLQEGISAAIRAYDDDSFHVSTARPRADAPAAVTPPPVEAPRRQLTQWDAVIVGATCIIFMLVYLGLSAYLK